MNNKFCTTHFLDWMHRFTVIGYGFDLMVTVEDAEIVYDLYIKGMTPEQGVEEYIAILKENI